MRLLLLVAVVALGLDALKFDGAYTQWAWQTIGDQVSRLGDALEDGRLFDRQVAVVGTEEDR